MQYIFGDNLHNFLNPQFAVSFIVQGVMWLQKEQAAR